jgi:hypothetical protein
MVTVSVTRNKKEPVSKKEARTIIRGTIILSIGTPSVFSLGLTVVCCTLLIGFVVISLVSGSYTMVAWWINLKSHGSRDYSWYRVYTLLSCAF